MKVLIRDLQAGQNYKLQVRANNGISVSEWSRVFDLTTVIDNIAGADPTGLTVVQEGTTSKVSWSHSGLNTDGSTMMDFAYFEVEAYSDGVTAFYRTGLTSFQFTYDYNIITYGIYKTNVGFRVRVVDTTGNASNWTSRVFGTDTAPSKPSDPAIIKDGDLFFVQHNLQKDAGGRLETDVDKLRVYTTAAPTVVIATIAVNPTDVFAVSGTFTYSAYSSTSIFVKAEDMAGNLGPASDSVAVSSFTTGLYANYAVISVAFIDFLDANKIRAGTGVIDNITVKSTLTMGSTRDPFTGVPAEGNYTILKSSNYAVGSTGYIMRGDGYAEFRQLAANSLSVGKFDFATQSMMQTKFTDAMEDPTLWGRHTTSGTEEVDGGTVYLTSGTFAGNSNTAGALTGKTTFSLTGEGAIRRKSGGLQRGIAFDATQVYKITARLRQLKGPLTNFISNPSAHRASAGAGLADNWVASTFFAGGGTQTATVVSSPVHSGSTAQKLSHSALPSWPETGNGHTGFETQDWVTMPINVVGGGTYTASCYMRLTAGTNVKGTIVLVTLDSSGATINGFAGGAQIPLVTDTWVRVDNTYTAESNCAQFRVLCLALNAQASGTQTVDVIMDSVMLTKTPTTVTYFDGSTADHGWTGATNNSPSYEINTHGYKIGVLGFDSAGALNAYDGSTSHLPDNHYMVAADNADQEDDNLPIWDGTQAQKGGWIEYTGFIQGVDAALSQGPGKHSDPFSPAKVHPDTAFIVPYVSVNIDYLGSSDVGMIAELDSFVIESTNTLTPNKISTIADGSVFSGSDVAAITIEDIAGDSYGPGMRMYSGTFNEFYPGLVTEFAEPLMNNVRSILISPPQEYLGSSVSYAEGLKIRGRTGNFLSNSSFEYDWVEVNTGPNSESNQFSIWKTNATITQDLVTYHDGFGFRSAKITSAASGNSFIHQRLMMYNYPELLNQQTFTVSAWVFSPNTNPATLNTGIWFKLYDFSDTLIEGQDSITSGGTAVADNDTWTRVSKTFTLTNPVGVGCHYINVGWGFNATAGSQIMYVDNVQLEMGSLGNYQPQTLSSMRMAGAGTVIGGQLLVSDKLASISDLPLGKWRVGIDYLPEDPAVMVEKDGLYAYFRRRTLTISGGASLSELEIGLENISSGADKSPIITIKSSDDFQHPNTLFIKNSSYNNMARFGSNVDPTNASVTLDAKDLTVYGSFRAEGAPIWTAPVSLGTNVVSHTSSQTIASFYSNGIVTLRGLIDFTGTVATGATLFTLPVGHRPATIQYIGAIAHDDTVATAGIPVQLSVSTGGLVVLARAPASMTSTKMISLSGLNFTTSADATTTNADGTNPTTPGAATSPGSITITPYASGVSTGTYQINWTNANDLDNASLRIVWNPDHTPANSEDGTVVTIATVNNAAQSTLISGLPVNRTIYFKVWAVNQAGVVGSAGGAASRYLLESPVTISAVSTASYRTGNGGQWRTDNDAVYQGEYNVNDNHRGLWFYGTAINTKLTTGGVSARVPTRMNIYMHRITASGPTTVSFDLYVHAHATKPAGIPTIPTTNTQGNDITALKVNQGTKPTVPSAWYAGLASGTHKGFAIYHATGAYGILAGKSILADSGQLEIWHKG